MRAKPAPLPTVLLVLFVTRRTDGYDNFRPRSNTSDITHMLDELVNRSHYDKRLRPNYAGNPVDVGITIHVSSISAVSEVEMDFTLDFYLRQMWKDPRLNFRRFGIKQDHITVGIDYVENIWVPDTFFPNEKSSFFHKATTHNSFLRINEDGDITTSQRLTVTATCPMVLHLFPLDSQKCTLEIESYGYSTKDIKYMWNKGEDSIGLDKRVELPQFLIVDREIKEKTSETSTGSYSRLICRFLFTRSIGFYMIQIYLPSILIVIISWVSFWLSRDATPARVSLGVTTVLTMTTLMTTTNAAMPKVSYVKSIDIYLGTCFLMVFASLLEYAAVGYLNKKQKMKMEARKPYQSDRQPLIAGQAHLQAPFSPQLSAGPFSPRMSPNMQMNARFFSNEPPGYRQLSMVQQSPTNALMTGAAQFQEVECDCDIEKDGYSESDIKYTWKANKTKDAVTLAEEVELPQFVIANHTVHIKQQNLSTGIYSRLSVHVVFQRTSGFYLMNIYLPSILIVIISWVSFWLSREAAPARVALGVTTVLTMTTLMTTTNVRMMGEVADLDTGLAAKGKTIQTAQMPKVSYVKAIDYFLGFCFVMVFASLLEYAAVGYLNKKLKMKREMVKKRKEQEHAQRPVEYPLFQQDTPPTVPSFLMQEKTAGVRFRYSPNSGPAMPTISFQGASSPQPLLQHHQHMLSGMVECDCDLQPLPRPLIPPVVQRIRTPRAVRSRSRKITPSIIDKYSRAIFPAIFTGFNDGFAIKDLNLLWFKGMSSVSVADDISLPTFDMMDIVINETAIGLSTGAYSRLRVTFFFTRNIGFYFIQIYLPALLVVIISWVSFWVSRESAPARVLLGITTVLTITTLMTNTNRQLPPVSYLKAVDIYLGVCYFMVVAALLEYACVGYSGKKRQDKKKQKKNESTQASNVHPDLVQPQTVSGANHLLPCTCPDHHPETTAAGIIETLDAVPSLQVPAKKRRRARKPKWCKFHVKIDPNVVDKYSRIFFPGVFTTFNIVYWVWVMKASNRV